MIVYTVQIARWRRARDEGIAVLDTTVRSGDKAFAPSWSMVMAHKQGVLSNAEYTAAYRVMMIQSFKDNAERWREVVRGDPVALACYCRPGSFCHRHLLADLFAELCQRREIPFYYRGEL